MKRLIILLGIALSLGNAIAQQAYNVRSPYDPATQKMAEEMQGEVMKFTLSDSQLYPGTQREVLVYVPQQYDATKPACLLVCMDGILYDATTVMDNLIASGEMPVTIGVFVNPGVVYDENGEVVRYNRCKEFDSTDDTFSRFIENEVLAKVEGMKTASGKTVLLSKDANDRAITGASSGGIAAFSVAWNRPDLYSRVYTTVGTFVAMRGGNNYSNIVRKTEPKPLRIYMQDGWYDVWNPIFGEWFEHNLLMESAFNFAGYEVFHKWDRGNHSIKYGTIAFPDAMRWLWKGYPAKVQKGWSNNGMLQDILLENEDWQEVVLPATVEGDLFAATDSSALFASRSHIYKVSAAGQVEQVGALKAGERLMGEGLTAKGSGLYKNGVKVADGLSGLQAVQALADNRYVVLTTQLSTVNCQLSTVNCQLSTVNRQLSTVNCQLSTVNCQLSTVSGCRALAIAPDYRFCVTGEENTHHLTSTVIDKTGKMLYSEPFYYLHDLSNSTLKPSGAMAFDTKGNLYVATELGVQVADHNGRVRAILSLPAGRVHSLAFSGKYLFVRCGDKVYMRKMKAEGHLPVNGKVLYNSQGQG